MVARLLWCLNLLAFFCILREVQAAKCSVICAGRDVSGSEVNDGKGGVKQSCWVYSHPVCMDCDIGELVRFGVCSGKSEGDICKDTGKVKYVIVSTCSYVCDNTLKSKAQELSISPKPNLTAESPIGYQCLILH